MTTLGEIAVVSGARLRGGDTATVITGVASLDSAETGQLSFLIHSRYRHYLPATRAAAVIVSPRDAAACPAPALIADNPHIAYARAAALFEPVAEPQTGVHSTAWVDSRARIAKNVWIGPHCVVEAGATIETGVSVGPHCVIGEQALIGAASRLMARVTVCHRVRLGRRVLVHPGAVIGSDGFGLALEQDGRWLRVPQLGSVRIGDDVEIGANTTIDRGALEDTVIEDGVKLDNQIQIAHNVHIGAHSALAGCVGIAGSARIGRHCMLGGGVGVAGHLTIADRVQVTGMSLVAQSITQSGVYSSGLAVEPNRLWNRISARLRRLDELFRRLTALEKTIKRQDGSV
ncbi:MAG: UDP-3-O-(3-hydroxymyristoyl)glucosamine N-acyltransferase [Candidatus Competibacteraceae bacterium]|nr:UDP-3-O-(3-hydroxymyristoyl)glucosamine N-acyltransferase [Candidatus Competibacteraceae bacterium]MCP5124721.1 UDP-3-O-(3-hydroxymyristoyl)glucosamine N-acyltransferase [Gammaproteobacteria bacterium]HRX70834.1 UDP-3-O-(3-hydroxymyristoyl)glucosamine N-acyltransferase [Candidatus Competibacteraceae bacterium]